MRNPPTLLKLDERATYACKEGLRAKFNRGRPVTVQTCTVYTFLGAFQVEIEVQRCPRCPPQSRRDIGPETRDIGLFNYNNSVLFTHELFNEYISAFTSSETPFEAWVLQVSRRYLDTQSSPAFVGGKLFRAAWFAYVRLMVLEGDKTCPSCKDYLENIIFDGVSLAFGRKHVDAGLEPPTTTTALSPVRNSSLCPKQQWVVDSAVRKQLRNWLQGGGMNGAVREGDRNEEKELMAALSRREQFLDLINHLKCLDFGLAHVFETELGWASVDMDNKWRPQQEYLGLFELVSRKKDWQKAFVLQEIVAICGRVNSPNHESGRSQITETVS